MKILPFSAPLGQTVEFREFDCGPGLDLVEDFSQAGGIDMIALAADSRQQTFKPGHWDRPAQEAMAHLVQQVEHAFAPRQAPGPALGARTRFLNGQQRILRFYRDQGFLIALDDIGAGYASLNYLHALRPDFIKIDMGIVRGVHADPFKGEVARHLIQTAIALKIKVIAEGVETREEFQWLRDAGAQYQQGYLFGRPDPLPATRLARVS